MDASAVGWDRGAAAALAERCADVQEFVSDGGANVVIVANTDSDFTYLYGGSGNDTLSTVSGGGYLFGEGGTNVLTGGVGLNVFAADGTSGIAILRAARHVSPLRLCRGKYARRRVRLPDAAELQGSCGRGVETDEPVDEVGRRCRDEYRSRPFAAAGGKDVLIEEEIAMTPRVRRRLDANPQAVRQHRESRASVQHEECPHGGDTSS
jgi:hypothetical protein